MDAASRHSSGSRTYAVMPTASRRSVLSTRSRISNVLMSRLVRLTSRCVANAGVDAAVEDGALALGAGRQPHRQRVADAHAIDVALLDVGADPQIVGVDQRDDRLARVDDLADARGAHVDDAVDRRVDLGVARAGRRPSRCCADAAACMCSLVCTWLRRTAICSAFERASATVARCASTCFFSASSFAWAAVVRGARLHRAPAATRRLLARQVLRARVGQPRVLEVGGGRRRPAPRSRRASTRPGGSDRRSAAPEAAAPPRTRAPATTALRRSARSRRVSAFSSSGDDDRDAAGPS